MKKPKPAKRYKDRRKRACLNTFVTVRRVNWMSLKDGDVVWLTHRRSEHRGGDFQAGESLTVRETKKGWFLVSPSGIGTPLHSCTGTMVFWKVAGYEGKVEPAQTTEYYT